MDDIVFVTLSRTRAELTQGNRFGTTESVKAVTELYAPASRTVADFNAELKDALEKINHDPRTAWMIRLTLKKSGKLCQLGS